MIKLDLDLLTAAFTGWMAIMLFILHIVSSPKRRNWMTIPQYVRGGFALTGGMFTWRSANLLSLAGRSPEAAGHPNSEAVMVAAVLCYLLTALAVWMAAGWLEDLGWDRLAWAQRFMRHNPSTSPVMLDRADIANIARASGMATVSASEGPSAVAREARRGAR